MATASRERCYLVCGVTLLMEGSVGAGGGGGLPKDGDEGEWSRFKVSICVPVEPGRRCSSLHPAQRNLPASESARVRACVCKTCLCRCLW